MGLLDQLLAMVVPPTCLSCRRHLLVAGQSVCQDCRLAFRWLPAPDRLCARCALPLPCSDGRGCPARKQRFDRAWSPLEHRDTARTLVGAVKFRRSHAGIDTMAAQIVAAAPVWLFKEGTALVHVPVHPAHGRERGFDQALLLARAIGRRTGLPVSRCLRRQGHEASQRGRSRQARLAFTAVSVVSDGAVPLSATLVDDVHTTGATLDSCAAALRDDGARQVFAVTYTRVLRR